MYRQVLALSGYSGNVEQSIYNQILLMQAHLHRSHVKHVGKHRKLTKTTPFLFFVVNNLKLYDLSVYSASEDTKQQHLKISIDHSCNHLINILDQWQRFPYFLSTSCEEFNK
jgi:hypothetical protein